MGDTRPRLLAGKLESGRLDLLLTTTGDRQLKLTKLIPARLETVVFEWCKRDFLIMGPDFRAARRRVKKKFNKCDWCNHDFKDGDMMAIASPKAPTKSGNKMLCQSCATELLESDETS